MSLYVTVSLTKSITSALYQFYHEHWNVNSQSFIWRPYVKTAVDSNWPVQSRFQERLPSIIMINKRLYKWTPIIYYLAIQLELISFFIQIITAIYHIYNRYNLHKKQIEDKYSKKNIKKHTHTQTLSCGQQSIFDSSVELKQNDIWHNLTIIRLSIATNLIPVHFYYFFEKKRRNYGEVSSRSCAYIS